MDTGEILLERKNVNFKAGFCIINEDLPNLIKKVAMLHPDEKTYFETLKFDRRKKSYLLGRIASKQAVLILLDKYRAIDSFSVGFGVFQFPVIKNIQEQNVQVSITHCDNYGIAFSFLEEHPLGVDIEKIDDTKIKTMSSFIFDQEYDLISSCSIGLAIGSTLIWTIKESLSKVLKTGLTIDFKLLEIASLKKMGATYISTFKYFSQYKVISQKTGNYMCSIVLPKKTTCDLSDFWEVLIKSNAKKEH